MRLMMLRTAGGATGGEGSSGYRSGGRSPIGIGGAVAIHALAAGIFLLMPKEMIDTFKPDILRTYAVPDDPPPPEQTPPETESKVEPQSHPTVVEKPVVTPPPSEAGYKVEAKPFAGMDNGKGIEITSPVTPPMPDPVLVDASIDPRALAAFQPDYPGTMVRQGMEGKVTVRVTIAADGHVIDIERLSATDESFWLTTQRHALRKWRFRPATRDGLAVSSTKVLTVYFRLADV
ncbi:energy transducer TonB [Sphingobium sp. LB126]|uniref:energy transducer TonB n=1 Tax=Sphingobium sp. LB126 TaxID=1983755 RepID=UPI001F5B628F|nr:energy transducer TonB [Sphingobium sp. LB126]